MGLAWGLLQADTLSVQATLTAQLAGQSARHVVGGGGKHLQRIADVSDPQRRTATFPIMADPDCGLARLCERVTAARSFCIIDPDKKIRLTMTCPVHMGRNFGKILREVGALQTAGARHISTPTDWVPGAWRTFQMR